MTYSLPNILSFLRVLFAPFVYQMIRSGDHSLIIYALAIYSIGAITDYLDGLIARKWENTSSFGSFLDPIADKVLTNAALLGLMAIDIIATWIIIIIIGRDIFITLLRIYADRHGMPIITSFTAKVKTAIQLTCSIIILLILSLESGAQLIYSYGFVIDTIMYGIAFLTVYTSVEYCFQNKLLLNHLLLEPRIPGLKTMIATCFGIGYSPFAPGTIASVMSILVTILPISHFQLQIVTVIAIILAIPSIRYVESLHGDDSSVIVIDEVIGMWIILSVDFVTYTPGILVLALFLFRLFDIFKPFPINIINRKKGAFWVLADDIVAAFLTIAFLYGFMIIQIGSNLLLMR
ncbi:MAG: CDP-diacylglycerol--glycerol-3-phosphate 3-phosphatidyltransferase [Ignavibacteria bacterium]|nr:CDP-diacylglycerol--glycerol-3-phosphate 3-phosphatidyltransferase [Ignavibacteria bacterium]